MFERAEDASAYNGTSQVLTLAEAEQIIIVITKGKLPMTSMHACNNDRT